VIKRIDVGYARGRKWKVGPGTRKIAVALTRLLLSFVILAGLAHAGGRYFYCPEMGQMQPAPCSVASHGGDGDGSGGTICPRRLDCCELWTLPSMPSGITVAEAGAVAPPPLVAMLPPLPFLLDRAQDIRRNSSRASELWRTPPRRPGELRAQLMVFLT
jgi:hypothetical protein